MAVKNKRNKGHENVLRHAEALKDKSLGRLEARIALFRKLIKERQESLIPLKGLPVNPTKFLENHWLPEGTDDQQVKVSRSTLYKKEAQYLVKMDDVKKLCDVVNKPKFVAKKQKDSDVEIEKLNIRVNNLAEFNAHIEQQYQQQIIELKTRISELLEENERLESIVANRISNVTSIF